MMPILSARFFGFPTIEMDGRPVKIERRKSMALLVYLLVEAGVQAHTRAALAALFWPGMQPVEADWSLNNALWDLNQALGDGLIATEDDRLRVSQRVWVDVLAFDSLAGAPSEPADSPLDRLAEAAALYRGDFLSGFRLDDSPAFDHWQSNIEDRLRAALASVLQRLAETYDQAGQFDPAIAIARRWIALDPLNEPAHCALVRYLAAAGQQFAAQRAYEDCAHLLADELDIEPSPAAESLYRQLRAGHLPARPPEQTALPARIWTPLEPLPVAAGPSILPGTEHLPEPATPFVGREDELGKIAGLLADPDARLITLLGPGGSGKSRLAIQAVRLQLETASAASMFPDGIFFIPLAAYHRADDVLPVIAGAVNCPLQSGLSAGEGQARLAHYLAGRRCLLVFDNLEHLMPAITWVADLLSDAPGIKLLLTTRQRFNMPVEWVLEVEGMPVPGVRERGSLESYSSVQLFLRCAARTLAGFTPAPGDWSAIGRICQMVEGLPLGIELAAAWVRMFSPAQIADSIERNLDFLYAEAGVMPERHQSLRAAFEYSWRLLSERERSAFRKLAIFQSDFDPAAAAQVAAAPLPLLADLLDRSLLRRAAASPGRYEIHEVRRKFAREKLLAEPYEEADAQDFHRAYYLNYLTDLFDQMKGSRQAAALRDLENEADNIDQAWQRALAERRFLDLQRAAQPLILFYEAGPRRSQALAVFEVAHLRVEALNPGEFDSPARRALLALLAAAHKRFLFGHGRDDLVLKLHQQAADNAHRLPDALDKALALLLMNVGPTRLEPAQITRQLEESIRIFSAFGDDWGEAMAHLVLGDNAVFHLNDLGLAHRSYQRSIEAFNRLNHDWGRALCLSGLGNLAVVEGNLVEAARLWSESVDLYHKTNDLWREVDVRGSTSDILARLGRMQESLALQEKNLDLLQSLGASERLAWAMARTAYLTLQMGDEERSQVIYRQALDVLYSLDDLEGVRRLEKDAATWRVAA